MHADELFFQKEKKKSGDEARTKRGKKHSLRCCEKEVRRRKRSMHQEKKRRRIVHLFSKGVRAAAPALNGERGGGRGESPAKNPSSLLKRKK